jgi:hypothetical protein
MGFLSAEVVYFVSVTHDVLFLNTAPCQELQWLLYLTEERE